LFDKKREFMIAVLSPSKTLDFETAGAEALNSPIFRKQSKELVSELQKKSKKDLMKLMSISEKLGELNYQRYQNFSDRYTTENSKSAVHAFKGDVYLGLEAESLTDKELKFSQEHIRILSGLYGILKPLDKMQPYRLEMGTKLKNKQGKNLYAFWGDQITEALNKEFENHQEKILVNLASQEYFDAINTDKLNARVVNVDFREYRDGKLRFISFNAKKARGMMARYIIKNKVDSFKKLQVFNMDGYKLQGDSSDDDKLCFVR